MANVLIDNKTNRTLVSGKDFPESETNQMILSGRYGFAAGNDEKVFLKDSTGRPVVARGDLANSYIRDGTLTYATALEVERYKQNNEFANSTLGGFSAAAMGVDDWLFAGLGTHALERSGIIGEGVSESVQAQNPFLWNSLGVPSALVASFFSGGTTGAARGALAGARAATQSSALKAAASSVAKDGFNKSGSFLGNYTLPGITAKVGEKVARGSEQAFFNLGEKYVPRIIQDTRLAKNFGPHAAKVMGATTGAMVESGLWGAGEGISEAIIGEPGESAEHILNSIGTNALMGAAFAAPVSSILPILTGAKGFFAKAASLGLDLSGRTGAALLDKNRRIFVETAKKTLNLSDQDAEEFAKLLMPGDVGADAYRQLDQLIDKLDVYARRISDQVDVHLITDDILQIADQGGFSQDAIERYVRHSRLGTEPGFDSDFFDGMSHPRIQELQKLIENTEGVIGNSAAFNNFKNNINAQRKRKGQDLLSDDEVYDMLYRNRDELAGELDELKANADNPVMGYDPEAKMPDTSLEVLENLEAPFARFRKSILEVLKENQELDAVKYGELRSQLQEVVHQVNMNELRLFRDLLDDDTIRAASKTTPGANQTTLETYREKLKPKQQASLSKYTSHFQKMLDDQAAYKRIHDLFKKAQRKKNKAGDLIAEIDENELKDAIGIAARTADAHPLFNLAQEYGVNMKTVLRGSGTSDYTKFRQIAKEANSVNISGNASLGIKNHLLSVRDRLDRYIEEVENADFFHRTTKVGDNELLTRGTMSYMDLPGPIAESGKTWRQTYQDILRHLGYHEVFDAKVTAKAWKSMETAQTHLLDVMKRGYIGKDEAVQNKLMNVAIDNLRRSMRDKSSWGQLAIQKEKYDQLRLHFEKLRQQVLSRFTSDIGIYQMADPEKIASFIRKSDKHTSDVDALRLSEYAESAREVLKIMREDFQPVDLMDTPKEVRDALTEKLKRLNRATFDQETIFDKGLRENWGDRLKDLDNYIGETSKDISDSVDFIKEKLPIARLLLGGQGATANMNQNMRDFARTGIFGGLTFAVTGSSRLAMAAGAMSGVVGLGQTPRQLVSLVNQLRSARIASQNVIGEYLEDWAKNQVPNSAIRKGWEYKSRQALFVAASSTARDRDESRAEIRRKAAKSRALDTWAEKIDTAFGDQLTDENFFDARNAIERIHQSPMLMGRFLEKVTAPFDSTPEIQLAMKALIKKHVAIANREMPPTTQATVFGEEYPPTPEQLARFQRILQVLTDPTDTILTAMLTGTLTPKMVQVLSEAWPQIHADIIEKAAEMISDKEVTKALSQGQKQTLSTLMGMNYSNPEELARLQAPYEDEEKPARRGGGQVARLAERQQVGTSDSILYRA